MSDALSIVALEAIATRMRGITKANGFRTDAGRNVSVEKDYALSRSSPNLFVGAVEMSIDAANSTHRQRSRTMEVVIEFSLPMTAGELFRTVHNGLADVLDALPNRAQLRTPGSNAPTTDMGGLNVTGTRILRRPEGADVVVAQVTASITLTERPTTAVTR